MVLAAIDLPMLAWADGGYYLEPSLSVYTIYDDNIFYTFTDEESSHIARYSPSLGLGYEQSILNWNVVYRIDLEDYIDNDNISDGVIRRFADTSLHYQPIPRLILSGDVRYTKTDTPADLTLVPGGSVRGSLQERTNVKRISFNPSVTYRLSPTATGILSYIRTEDSISSLLETDIRRMAIEMQHAITSKTSILYGYFEREVRYDESPSSSSSADNASSESSGTTWVGLSRDLTPTIVASVRGGSRSANGRSSPYWTLSIEKDYRRGEAVLAFERNETTAPGTTDSQEFETVNATIVHKYGLNWVTTITPSYAKITQRSGSQKIYRLAISSNYRFNEFWSLTASYERNHQPIEFSEADDESIDRNVALIGITYIYPK